MSARAATSISSVNSALAVSWASPTAQQIKNLLATQEAREMKARSLGWEDPLGKEVATPLQFACLENPMDRGAWQATVHGVAKSQT